MSRFCMVLVVPVWLSSLSANGQPSGPSGKPLLERSGFSAPSRSQLGADRPTNASSGAPASEARLRNTPQPRPAVVPVPVVLNSEATGPHVRTVCRLKSAPAVDVAAAINQLLAAEGQAAVGLTRANVVIVPDPVSNSLVIGGPQAAVDEVRELLIRLDCPAAMVRLEIVLADVPVARAGSQCEATPGKEKDASPDASRGQFDLSNLPADAGILCRAQLTTLDNQAASLHVGRRQPMVTGVSVSAHGQTNAVTYENVGTRIVVTPHVDPNGPVTLDVDVEDSRLGPPDESVVLLAPNPSGKSKEAPGVAAVSPKDATTAESSSATVRPPQVQTMTTQSTVRVPDGQTVVLAGLVQQARSKQRLLLLTPRILRLEPR